MADINSDKERIKFAGDFRLEVCNIISYRSDPDNTTEALRINILPQLMGLTYVEDITMQCITGEIDLADNCELRIGDSDDLKLFHQGSHSVIAHGGTGDLQIRATDSGKNFIIYDHDASNEWFKLDASGNAVFNEGSADVDFRVESNSMQHIIFVNGGTDKIAMNDALPEGDITIQQGADDDVAGDDDYANDDCR